MSSTQTYAANDVDVDLGRLFASLGRNWLRILGWALAVTALAFLFAWTATPKYRGETRLLIESRESVFTQPDNRNQPQENPLLDEEGVTSQVEIIGSSDILRKVATDLKLADRPEFDEAADLSILDHLLIMTGMKPDPLDIPADERVLKRMREKLQVYRVEKSRVIVVEFSSEDRKLAASVPNAIADAYMAVGSAAKRSSTADATGWLRPEIADLTQHVKDAEAKVAEFRAKSDLLVGQNQSILATQQLSELSTELSRVRANRAAAEATAEGVRAALRNGASLDALPKVLESPLIQRLRERQVQLKADIADLSTTLLGSHPRIRALNSQLADLESQIRDEARNVLNSLSTEADTAKAREAQLVSDLNQMKVESARAGEQEVELRALEREAAAQRQLLESYMTRYREAASRTDGNYLPADARVIAKAVEPSEPYFPKVLPITAAAFAGSLLVITLITLLRELASGNAMRAAPGARVVPAAPLPIAASAAPPNPAAAPVVAVAKPAPAAKPAPVVMPPKRSTLGEIDVKRAVEKLIAGGASRAIVVSPEGDDGSAAAVLMAREAADSGLRTLLLDLTESGAASATMLEGGGITGITNLLCGEAQFADVIHSDHYSECHVIPVGTADPVLAMRAVERLPLILDSLATVYDLTVIECGPANAAAIKRLASKGSAVVVSVIDTSDMDVARSAAELRAAGYADLTLVTPGAMRNPPSPAPSPLSGRTAA